MISPSSSVIATSGIVGMLNKMSGRIFSYQADHSIHQLIYHNYKYTKQYPPNPRKTIGPGPTRQRRDCKLHMLYTCPNSKREGCLPGENPPKFVDKKNYRFRQGLSHPKLERSTEAEASPKRKAEA